MATEMVADAVKMFLPKNFVSCRFGKRNARTLHDFIED